MKRGFVKLKAEKYKAVECNKRNDDRYFQTVKINTQKVNHPKNWKKCCLVADDNDCGESDNNMEYHESRNDDGKDGSDVSEN